MIDTTAIRNKILLFAMSGQLTEQIDEDGRASDLLLRNNSKRSQLEKTGKIKKEKKLPAPPDEEKYFEIPSSWEWIYMGDIFLHNTGKALNSSDTEGELLDYITTSNLYWDRFELDSLKQMHFKPEEIEKCTITKGDLLVCEGGDIGRSAIWKYDYDMRIQNHIHKLRAILAEEICAEFYFYVMMLYKQNNWINGRGIGLQGFSSKRLHSLVVPLPPYAEQQRIVEQISDAFAILNKIDSLQQQYSEDINILKGKLVDAGIRGVLTERLSEDGTAASLLHELSEGRTELVRQGEIRKKKILPKLQKTEYPFEIPRNWEWVHISDVWAIINGDRGKNYPAKSTLSHTGIPFISALNLDGETVVADEKLLCLSDEQYEKLGSGKLKKGDVVVCIRGSLGKHGKYPFDQGAIASSLIIARNYLQNEVINDYLMVYLDSRMFRDEIEKYNGGSAQPNLAAESFEKFRVPLPPLAEQERIVTRVKELFKSISE
ncbi:MAG: restriction endonuclease subunit S [Lachnospiraceae bacterium]|nr:restriction endonuclease subunit S [Lachnospiraceae bacterium]